ncbi:MAG: Mitochondrial distribution and morphology protein 10 [Bogoriella megaspora]|nr:MAG: Mitochondrial distribution and morphology protein 10 [Bogoriella megaspora]
MPSGPIATLEDKGNNRSLGGTSMSGAKGLEDDVTGVLKARVDQNWNIGVLWEGRIKELLFSIGAGFDLRQREQIFRAVGLEVQYSSVMQIKNSDTPRGHDATDINSINGDA